MTCRIGFSARLHGGGALPQEAAADLQSDLPKALAEARDFAQAEYPPALQQGDALPAADRKKIVANSPGSPACRRRSSKTTICGWTAACSASICCATRG